MRRSTGTPACAGAGMTRTPDGVMKCEVLFRVWDRVPGPGVLHIRQISMVSPEFARNSRTSDTKIGLEHISYVGLHLTLVIVVLRGGRNA